MENVTTAEPQRKLLLLVMKKINLHLTTAYLDVDMQPPTDGGRGSGDA